jgi:hypothetical protein
MVALYIYDFDGQAVNRIELFNDEKISVTSSIQNFNDIGKLFTDYSQTFTVPASKHNNTIFKHWYESAVGLTSDEDPLDVDFAFDHRIKYYGYIEIDSIPFRDGKFLMQKANKKNNFIESYTINFVGNLVQLKDKFKEDKLNVLEGYEELNFEYNINNVVAVSRPNIKFPLIASDRRYEYMTGTSSDITTNTGAIYYTDLFPAIRVSKIFEYIEATYDLNFQGDFLTYTQFKDLFLYCKNSEEFNFFGQPQSPPFDSKDSGFPAFDLALGQCTISFDLDPIAMRLESWIKVQPTDPTIKYTVEIFDNGQLYATYTDLEGDSDLGYYSKYRQQENTINGQYVTRKFTYKITSQLPMTYDLFINLKRNYGIGAIGSFFYKTAFSYANTTSGDLQIRKYVPDLTVEAFVTAIVKALNLVVIPINENTFEFQPLEAFYQEGRIVDLSEYIHAEDIEINRPNLFRQISFKYEKSDNVLNTNYRNRENQDYGDLIFDNPNSAYTTNYEIKLPFENIMWERYTGTNFLTATCWNINLQPYVPKPVLLYYNGQQSFGATGDPIKYTANGTTFNVETTYPRFSNEINLGGSDLSYLQTLNWGDEVSTWHLSSAPTGLFQKYYANSIFNIYNQRTRVIKAKAQLDTYWLTSLKLNDRIVVSNKRYLINTMTTDLTTGAVDFELINDFRDIQGAVARRYSNIQGLEIDNTAQNIEVQLYRIDYDYFNVVASGGFLSYPLTSNNDTDIILKLTISANTTGVYREDSVALQYYLNGVETEVKIPVYQNA